jgi:hypothetical protein
MDGIAGWLHGCKEEENNIVSVVIIRGLRRGKSDYNIS